MAFGKLNPICWGLNTLAQCTSNRRVRLQGVHYPLSQAPQCALQYTAESVTCQVSVLIQNFTICRDVDQTEFGDRLILFTLNSWQISLQYLPDLYIYS